MFDHAGEDALEDRLAVLIVVDLLQQLPRIKLQPPEDVRPDCARPFEELGTDVELQEILDRSLFDGLEHQGLRNKVGILFVGAEALPVLLAFHHDPLRLEDRRHGAYILHDARVPRFEPLGLIDHACAAHGDRQYGSLMTDRGNASVPV